MEDGVYKMSNFLINTGTGSNREYEIDTAGHFSENHTGISVSNLSTGKPKVVDSVTTVPITTATNTTKPNFTTKPNYITTPASRNCPDFCQKNSYIPSCGNSQILQKYDTECKCNYYVCDSSQITTQPPTQVFTSNTTQPIVANKVTIYTGDNFTGNYAQFGYGDYNLASLIISGIMDNSIRSVKIPSGNVLILYENDNFRGQSLQLSTDKATLDGFGFNNITSSLQVR